MNKKSFGGNRQGLPVSAYDIADGRLQVTVLDQGATLQSIRFDGVEVALGYDDIGAYERNGGYLGATVGRYANRIRGGKFTLDGREYQLDLNENGVTHLHGGISSIDRQMWRVPEYKDDHIILSVRDIGAAHGYPGDMDITVTFTVKDETLTISYAAVCTEDTPVNLTNHVYLSPNGVGSGKTLDVELRLNASHYIPIDDRCIPLCGAPRKVAGTPFDFTSRKPIGQDMTKFDIQRIIAGGYDHSFCIDGEGFREFCEIFAPRSGIRITGYTDQPAVQFYNGTVLDTTDGRADLGVPRYGRWEGFCLETQHHPDSPNRPEYPDTVLKAGELFTTKTSFKFERR